MNLARGLGQRLFRFGEETALQAVAPHWHRVSPDQTPPYHPCSSCCDRLNGRFHCIQHTPPSQLLRGVSDRWRRSNNSAPRCISDRRVKWHRQGCRDSHGIPWLAGEWCTGHHSCWLHVMPTRLQVYGSVRNQASAEELQRATPKGVEGRIQPILLDVRYTASVKVRLLTLSLHTVIRVWHSVSREQGKR